MIILVRKKKGFSILELRYPEKLENNKKYAKVIIRSFQDLPAEGWTKEKGCTLFIDLTKDLNAIWDNFDSNYRKHIRREERERIVVKRSNEPEDYRRFYKEIYLPLCKDKKLKPYPLQYMMQGDLWYSMREEQMLAGQIIFHDDKNASQSFNASKHLEYNGNRSITWAALQHYKNLGLKFFCFGGGFSDYKKRFGCELKNVYHYEIINNKFVKLFLK